MLQSRNVYDAISSGSWRRTFIRMARLLLQKVSRVDELISELPSLTFDPFLPPSGGYLRRKQGALFRQCRDLLRR